MKEDVGLELADEEDRERTWVRVADDPRTDRAREVVGEDADRAARRNLLVLRIERNDERGRVHLHCDRGTDDAAEERDHAARELGENNARIGGRVEVDERGDEVRRGDAAVAHRGIEELLLRREVAKDRRGRDVELIRDVGKRGCREAARAEGLSRGFEDLIARDARRAGHDVSKRRFTNAGLSMGVY